MSRTHVVIPDSHSNPEYNNSRFEALGKFILEVRPDIVVDIGDSADMNSLCSYDRGKEGYDSRRYLDDIDSYKDAMEKLWHPYKKAKKRYPTRIKCRGNHEERINTAKTYAGPLVGTFGINDLEEFRWNDVVTDLGTSVAVDGVFYNHYCPTPIMNKPLGGANPARAIIKQEHKSTTVGHSHLRSFAEERGILSLVVGCYIDYYAEYAKQANNNWWRGAVIKRGVEDGYYDHEWVSLSRIVKEFG